MTAAPFITREKRPSLGAARAEEDRSERTTHAIPGGITPLYKRPCFGMIDRYGGSGGRVCRMRLVFSIASQACSAPLCLDHHFALHEICWEEMLTAYRNATLCILRAVITVTFSSTVLVQLNMITETFPRFVSLHGLLSCGRQPDPILYRSAVRAAWSGLAPTDLFPMTNEDGRATG